MWRAVHVSVMVLELSRWKVLLSAADHLSFMPSLSSLVFHGPLHFLLFPLPLSLQEPPALCLSSLTQPASGEDQHFHHYCLPSPLILPGVRVRPSLPSQAPTFSQHMTLLSIQLRKPRPPVWTSASSISKLHPNINNKTTLISFRNTLHFRLVWGPDG